MQLVEPQLVLQLKTCCCANDSLQHGQPVRPLAMKLVQATNRTEAWLCCLCLLATMSVLVHCLVLMVHAYTQDRPPSAPAPFSTHTACRPTHLRAAPGVKVGVMEDARLLQDCPLFYAVKGGVLSCKQAFAHSHHSNSNTAGGTCVMHRSQQSICYPIATDSLLHLFKCLSLKLPQHIWIDHPQKLPHAYVTPCRLVLAPNLLSSSLSSSFLPSPLLRGAVLS